ncbi:MAG: hypothetical protein ACLGXA_16880 [Acidobacteriota bacterium]
MSRTKCIKRSTQHWIVPRRTDQWRKTTTKSGGNVEPWGFTLLEKKSGDLAGNSRRFKVHTNGATLASVPPETRWVSAGQLMTWFFLAEP